MNIRIVAKLFARLEQLRRHERWTRAQLLAFQAQELSALRTHAYAHSPFYRSFHKGLASAPLSELPVLTKATLMNNFDQLVTNRSVALADIKSALAQFDANHLYLDRYWVNVTSGSTGAPGVFLFDEDEWVAVLASFARAHEWAGVKISLTHRMSMASVASTAPTHMSAQVGETLKSWWMPALRLAATEPLNDMVTRLNQWKPQMLVTYASMARTLAAEQLNGRLAIRPHLIFSSAEVLTQETRHGIESAWGHAPFNQYAATEVGGIAAETAEHRGMPLFEDQAVFEVVDECYRPVPAGENGSKLLVTVLFNRTQPLIRYEISDSVRLSPEPAPNGWPFAVMADVQGRAEDVLQLASASGGAVSVHPLTFHRILDALAVTGWQVVQEQDGLHVLLSGAAGVRETDEALVTAVAQALAAQGAQVPQITVHRVDAIPKSASGKTPLIKALRAHRADPVA